MSKVHALESSGQGTHVVYHVAPPTGVNAAGIAWVAAALANGDMGTSQLAVGTAPGQITQDELDSIRAGQVAEIEDWVLPESGGSTAAQQTKTLDDGVATRRRDWVDALRRRLRFFGYVQG